MKKITFINLEISAIAHAQLVDELPAVDDVWEYVQEFLNAGYKVSLQSDRNTGNSSCYVTDRDEDSLNANHCMGAWASTADSAIEKVAIAVQHSIKEACTWSETKEYFAGRAGNDLAEYEQFLAWKKAQDER